jgi:hypothetical protein
MSDFQITFIIALKNKASVEYALGNRPIYYFHWGRHIEEGVHPSVA